MAAPGDPGLPGLTCTRVRRDSRTTALCPAGSSSTCSAYPGDRRQRVSSALSHFLAPPAATGAQRAHPHPLLGLQGLSSPKHRGPPLSQVCAHVSACRQCLSLQLPACLPRLRSLNSHPSAPRSRATGSSGDLLFTSWLPVGLLRRTQESQ